MGTPTGPGKAALVLVALALVVPLAVAQASVTWPGPGGGPERTGALPFQGPATNDTAFQVQLPGSALEEIVVHDGWAYIATMNLGFREDLDTDALWRVNLATAEVEKLFELPEHYLVEQPGHDVLFLDDMRSDSQELVALDVPTGEERWRVLPFPDVALPNRAFDQGVVMDGILYASVWLSEGSTPIGTGAAQRAGIIAVDVENGEVLWEWLRSDTDEEGPALALPGAGPASTRRIDNIDLSARDGRLFAYTRAASAYRVTVDTAGVVGYDIQYELWALDADTGQTLWMRNDTRREGVRQTGPDGATTVGDPVIGTVLGGMAAVTDTAVHIRLDRFVALNPATGGTIWSSEAGSSDQISSQGSTALGVRGDTFIGTSSQTVYRLDASTGDLVWQRTDTNTSRSYNTIPLAMDERTAYIPTAHDGEHLGLGFDAVDLATGDLVWHWHHMQKVGPPNGFSNRPAFAPGVLVWSGYDGVVNVVGRTEASLGAPQVEPEAYPQPGRAFEVDLSDTSPGLFGEATRYRVDWGDGTVTPWQASPTFTHTYAEAGTVTAKLTAGNDANQTATALVTMHVGASQPNFLETAFARENQDLTFGVLGIAIAVTGGAIGVARRRRHQTRLHDELSAIEALYSETCDQPAACEAQLTERRAHARGLLMDGELDQDQFRIIEERIDELRGELRVSMLDERFAFLPYGMVRTLQRMLADGRINAWEHEAFMEALEREDVLTEEQKGKVERLIGQWLERDAGG